jgi:large subunit ribosomal protein L25
MKRISLAVVQRTETGKGPARRLRVTGSAPAVLYGKKSEPLKLAVNIRDFGKILEEVGTNALFDLQIASGDGSASNRIAVLKERQIRPVDGSLVHLDFLEILMTEPLEVTIPLHFEGKPAGLERGGNLQTVSKDLRISCLPDDIPDAIVVNVSGLELGHSIHARDIELPAGASLAQDPGLALATVLAPKKAEEIAEVAEAPAEPAAPAKK